MSTGVPLRDDAVAHLKKQSLFFDFEFSPQAPAVIRSHFKHNVFMLDEEGDLLEHLGGTEELAAELYEITLKRWPMARIQMREGARIVYDSMRSTVV